MIEPRKGARVSDQRREITAAELSAAMAVVRGQSVDLTAFASLMLMQGDVAERLLAPGQHGPALPLVVLLQLVSRLRGLTDSSREDVEAAFQVFRLLESRGVCVPAPDLTPEEVKAAGAAIRGESPDVPAVASFLGESPSVMRGLIDELGASLTDVVITCLVLRLRGFQVELPVLADAIRLVLEAKAQQLRREAAH